MARAVLIKITCDICADETENEQQTALKLDRKEVLLDLCEAHKTELGEMLTQYLNKGVKQRKTPAQTSIAAVPDRATGEREVCRICKRTFIDREGVRKHLNRAHGMTLTAYDAGDKPPVKESVVPSVTAERPHECPECGGGYVNPQGLAAHRRQVHGVAGRTAQSA